MTQTPPSDAADDTGDTGDNSVEDARDKLTGHAGEHAVAVARAHGVRTIEDDMLGA